MSDTPRACCAASRGSHRRRADTRPRHRRQHCRLHRRQRRPAEAAAVPRPRSAGRVVVPASRDESRRGSRRSNYDDFVSETRRFRTPPRLRRRPPTSPASASPSASTARSVSWNYFNVLGVTMREGRGSSRRRARRRRRRRDQRGLWRRRFGGPCRRGRIRIHLDGRARTIVGIAPADVDLPAGAEFWRPLIFTPRDLTPDFPRRSMDFGGRAAETGLRRAAVDRRAAGRCRAPLGRLRARTPAPPLLPCRCISASCGTSGRRSSCCSARSASCC